MISPEAVDAFLQSLSEAEVRHYLDADPLGVAFVSADAAAARAMLFEVLFSRARFFREAVRHKAAVDAQEAAQMFLPLGGRAA